MHLIPPLPLAQEDARSQRHFPILFASTRRTRLGRARAVSLLAVGMLCHTALLLSMICQAATYRMECEWEVMDALAPSTRPAFTGVVESQRQTWFMVVPF